MATYSSQASKLQIDIAAVFVDIPRVTGFSFPSIEPQFEDITALDSAGNFTEYFPIMNDVSNISASMVWDPENAVHDALMDEAVAAVKTLQNWKAIASDTGAATSAFSGFVAKFAPTAASKQVLRATLDIRTSGAIVYTQ